MSYRRFGQAPPPQSTRFIPQFYPGIDELQKYGAAEQQEAAAGTINAQLKQEMQANIARLRTIGSSYVGDAEAIYNELLAVDNSVKTGNMPFKEAPMVPSHRKAAQLIADYAYPTISAQEELDILRQTLPTQELESSFLRANAMPILVGGSVLLLGTIGLILMVRL